MLLWNSEAVTIEIIGSTEQEIHAVVKVPNSNSSWLLSAIYSNLRPCERLILWDNLKNVYDGCALPWLAMGDFNEILSESENFGGGLVNFNRSLKFSDMLNSCHLSDLGFSGPRFTWTNLRDAGGLVQERLDRAVANPSWRLTFPNAEVAHLPRVHSDHCPILRTFNPVTQTPFTSPLPV
ncbi:uncharacterized protein LOC116200546 [Punica granatum]|uniref:Uncharacterized protein LOC116200546 n=1 Tax=Punica granatum TaxID=22663 RepID=A0A6P8CTS7_PUNGR|nr:uncharacterized protein LOC116200546 [Punica granatum]